MNVHKLRSEMRMGRSIYDLPLRVTFYARVSTDKFEQLNSLENQVQYYTEFIQNKPNWSYVEGYIDEGITGTSTAKRKEFNRMIQWCEQGKIDLVLTKSISRFARNTVDCLTYVRRLKAIGVPIIFENENINTAEMDSEFTLTLYGAMSQAESEMASDRIKWGTREAFRQGRVRYHYRHWYGYKKGEDEKPEIIPEEAVTVRRIFSMYAEGCSLAQIREALESEHICVREGVESWTINKIKNMLSNEKYTGDALLQKTYSTDPISKSKKKNMGEIPMYLVKNCHNPIVSHEIFDIVQAELERRADNVRSAAEKKQPEKKKTAYSSKYALTEKLVCGDCNTLYRRCIWTINGKKRDVWRCINRLMHGTRYCKNLRRSMSGKFIKRWFRRSTANSIVRNIC